MSKDHSALGAPFDPSMDPSDIGDLQASALALALRAGNMGAWYWNLRSNAVFFDATQKKLTGLGAHGEGLVANDFLDRIHPDDAKDVQTAVESAVENGSSYEAEFRYTRPDGVEIWIHARGEVRAGLKDGDTYLTGVNWDISEQKKSEDRMRAVSQEMAHRMKNVITVIGGISRMTAQSANDLEEYQQAFGQRLNALAGLNQLILGKNIRRPSMDNLVEDTLKGLIDGDRYETRIEHFELNEQASQTMVLCLNELATNAIKYGALSDPDGRVEIVVALDGEKDDFIFEWFETRERPIDPLPKQKGFGTQVLMGVTRTTFEGEPTLEWRPQGIHFRCRWSMRLFEMQLASDKV